MKKSLVQLNDKYSLFTLLKDNCRELKQNLGTLGYKMFTQDYSVYVFNFIGKWINTYFIKKNAVRDLNFSHGSLQSDGIFLVSSIFHHNSDIDNLNLSGCNMKKQDFQRLRKISSRFKNLLSLTLDNNQLTEEVVDDVFEIIINCSNLISLELDNVNEYNMLDNLFKCVSKKNRLKLETITLRENNLNSRSATLFLNFAENFSNLQSLNLSKNNLNSSFYYSLLSYFNKKRKLYSLVLEGNNLDDTNFEVFCEAILNTSTLVVLNLNKNNFTDKSARMLIDTLKDHKSLTNLFMNGNNIENNTLPKAINNLLKTNKRIKYLDFRKYFGEKSDQNKFPKKDEVKVLLNL